MKLDHKHVSSGSLLRQWGYRGEWQTWNDSLKLKLLDANRVLPSIHGLREQREALTQTLPKYPRRQAA